MPHEESSSHGPDDYKAFLSRVSPAFTDASLHKLLQTKFGPENVLETCLAYHEQTPNEKDDEEDDDDDDEDDEDDEDSKIRNKTEPQHKGYGFVTFASPRTKRDAIALGSVRGRAKENSKRKYTVYIGSVVREEEETDRQKKQVCFQWLKFRCQYGRDCKFLHEGVGSCLPSERGDVVDADGEQQQPKTKRQKCFTFLKKGTCPSGDKCPFSHRLKSPKPPFVTTTTTDTDPSQKDCISWKIKGKCRSKQCSYRHDSSVREAALLQRAQKTKKVIKQQKKRQPLSIRVFGLPYETSAENIRQCFDSCGPVTDVVLPCFDDNHHRCRGYGSVLFQSPKAVDKALEKDGVEFHGRCLSVKVGKMYSTEEEKEKWEKQGTREGVETRKEKEKLVGEFGQKVKKRKRHGYKE